MKNYYSFSSAGSAIMFMAFVLTLLAIPATAQDLPDPIETDRPDQTEAASTVPTGSLQVEAGFYFEKSRNGNYSQKYMAYPIALLRFGLLHWLEVRAEGAYQKHSTTGEALTETRKGLGQLALGTKVRLWQEKGVLPQAAFMLMVDLPAGAHAFAPDNPEPHLRLMLKNSLTEKFVLNYNLAYGWQEGEPIKGYAVSLCYALHHKAGIFGEVAGEKLKYAKATHTADAGVVYFLTPVLQLDMAAGISLTSQRSHFITTGVSIRLPR